MGDDSTSRSRLRVAVVDVQGRPVPGRGLASFLARAMPALRGSVTVALVSDADIRRLNRRYRGIDRRTDVLSFPIASDEAPRSRSSAADRPLGDIVIARGVASRQARRAGHLPQTEWRILALHGLLHLLGYDHASDDGRMARLERRLWQRMGLPGGLIDREAHA